MARSRSTLAPRHVAVYDAYQEPGWVVVGGTSVSSPLVAAVYALAGNTGGTHDAPRLYAHAGELNDVVGGSKGFCGGRLPLHRVPGDDGPTGLGTPRGDAAF